MLADFAVYLNPIKRIGDNLIPDNLSFQPTERKIDSEG